MMPMPRIVTRPNPLPRRQSLSPPIYPRKTACRPTSRSIARLKAFAEAAKAVLPTASQTIAHLLNVEPSFLEVGNDCGDVVCRGRRSSNQARVCVSQRTAGSATVDLIVAYNFRSTGHLTKKCRPPAGERHLNVEAKR